MIRTDMKNPLVELDELYMSVIIKTNEKVSPGMELKLKIGSIDPIFDTLRFEII